MDAYTLLKFGHVAGFVFLGGGLLAVFVSELRAYRTNDVRIFAEAARYTAMFYDWLALPGALLASLSGLFLVFELGYGFFSDPWLAGMWGLFLFEFIEGNTVTRIQFRRTLRLSDDAMEKGEFTEEMRGEARTLLGQAAHFLDVPLFLVIVYLGIIRPYAWSHVIVAVLVAVIASVVLMIAVPRLARRDPGS